MTFKDASFATRLNTMGDPSETAFESIYPNFHRTGLNRPPLDVARLGLKERNTPDYLTNDGYVECMGIGRDATLKLKAEKAVALCLWNHDAHTDLFVWDSTRSRWWRAPIWAWLNVCVQHAEVALFSDNQKPYWALKAKDFPTAATRINDDE